MRVVDAADDFREWTRRVELLRHGRLDARFARVLETMARVYREQRDDVERVRTVDAEVGAGVGHHPPGGLGHGGAVSA